MTDPATAVLPGLLPDRLQGKARLGRMMLRPFLDRTPAVLKDRAGRTYVLPSYAEPIAQHIFTYGAYEPDTRDAVLAFLPKSGAFIDVGANIGALSIPIACMRPDASIICVEADPDISRLLRANVSGNSCEAIRVIACVAGNADNKCVSFYPAPKEKSSEWGLWGLNLVAHQSS